MRHLGTLARQHTQGGIVERDQVEGKLKQAEGKAQEAWGEAKEKDEDVEDDVEEAAEGIREYLREDDDADVERD